MIIEVDACYQISVFGNIKKNFEDVIIENYDSTSG